MGIRNDGGYDGSAPPEWAQHADVEVDVGNLGEFANHLLDEYQHNLAPNWREIEPHFQRSSFGHSPMFTEAFHAGRRHAHILSEARDLVGNYASGLHALADAARSLSDAYGGADDLSAVDVSKAQVDAVLPNGESGSPPAAPPPPSPS